MLFESRKSFFLHRRKLHSSLPKIKTETSSVSTISEDTVKGEPFKTSVEDLVPKKEEVSLRNNYNMHSLIMVYILFCNKC